MKKHMQKYNTNFCHMFDDTGQARLIQNDSAVKFSFKLSANWN